MSPRRIAAALAVALLLAACGAGSGEVAGGAPDGQVRAIASVWALDWIARQVAPDAVVTQPGRGAEPHEVEFSPDERVAAEGADVWLYLGAIDFQPQLEQLAARSSARIVAASELAGPERLLAAAPDVIPGDEAADPTADSAAADGTIDPHLWLSPAIMADVAVAAGDAFAAADPAGAATYTANAQRVADDLRAVDDTLRRDLGACATEGARVVVGHAAFAYLLAPSGIEQIGIAPVEEPEAGATPERLAALTRLIRDEGLEAIVSDAVEGRNDAATLARETGTEVLEASTLEVVTDAQDELGLPGLLAEDGRAFAAALGCDLGTDA